MDVANQADGEWDRENPKSNPNSSCKPRCAERYFVFQTGVHKTVEKLMQEAIDNSKVLLINIAEQTMVSALETVM